MSTDLPLNVRKKLPGFETWVRQVHDIVRRHVCEAYGLPTSTLKDPRRQSRECWARMLVMHLTQRITKAGWTMIASFYGLDHGTVVYACIKWRGWCDVYREAREQAESIQERIEKEMKVLEQ